MKAEDTIYLKTNSHFGDQLRAIRRKAGINQLQLAEKMGCDSTNISHFEKGDKTFGNGSISSVFKYAKALGYKNVNFKL